jgi:hypothetical protein
MPVRSGLGSAGEETKTGSHNLDQIAAPRSRYVEFCKETLRKFTRMSA